MPVEAAPVLTYDGVLLTSVAATSTHDYTVVFLGTSNGHLKKVRNCLMIRGMMFSVICATVYRFPYLLEAHIRS